MGAQDADSEGIFPWPRTSGADFSCRPNILARRAGGCRAHGSNGATGYLCRPVKATGRKGTGWNQKALPPCSESSSSCQQERKRNGAVGSLVAAAPAEVRRVQRRQSLHFTWQRCLRLRAGKPGGVRSRLATLPIGNCCAGRVPGSAPRNNHLRRPDRRLHARAQLAGGLICQLGNRKKKLLGVLQ